MTLEWLKHAFAVEKADSIEPTEAQRVLIDRLCRQIVARELTTPALLFLETVRPLNYVTSQTLQFFSPLVSAAGGAAAVTELAAFLEHRGSIDYICRKIETMVAKPPCSDAANPDDSR
ncbi:MAG: hypothetical protein EXS05_13940 [Planctomycetaceae bacterium]|nr:hypothetical protein [Planctomycetaceae bacterium]